MMIRAKRDKIVFVSLILTTVLIGGLHYITPGHMILYHDTYRRMSYFPITVGAILFGLPGGIMLGALSSLFFVPHLFKFWAISPQAYYSELSEILFYMAAGIVVGVISNRENKLREKLKDSYKRLHEQAGKLVKAEKQLGQSQRLSMLGHVSASLAHEIKNPLASIKGSAEILADEIPEHHAKHKFIEIIRSEISRLNSSVEDVLNYCRGQQAQSEVQLESIEKIVGRAVSLTESRLKNKRISLVNRFNGEKSGFRTDASAMIQVLLNILLNAVDAVDRQGEIIINHFYTNSGYVVEISDTGPGIDQNKKQDLFEPFVTYKEGGTGLGLSISKRIVESLGGEITVEDAPSGGAKFIVYLKKIDTGTG